MGGRGVERGREGEVVEGLAREEGQENGVYDTTNSNASHPYFKDLTTHSILNLKP